MTQTATRPRTRKSSKTAYEPTTLARVYDKQSGACLGYLAPSRNGKDWYQVNSDDNARWHCNCLAGQHNQECCHIAAVKEQCKRRVEMGLPGCKEPVPTPGTSNDSYSLSDSATPHYAEMQDGEIVPVYDYHYTGTVNVWKSDDMALLESTLRELQSKRDEPIDEEAKWQEWMDELGRDVQKMDAEYEEWKRANGLGDEMTREAYNLLFGIYA